MRLPTTTGALVVVDRCVLSWRRVEKFVPAGADIVLSDTYFYEAFTGLDEHEGMAFKAWARRYADRICIARHSDDVADLEGYAGVPLTSQSIIHPDATKTFRERAKANTLKWPAQPLCAADDSGIADTSARVDRFRNLCRQWREFAVSKYPEMLGHPGTTADRHAAIREPDGITSWLLKNYPEYGEERWRGHRSVFPDRLAACRWLRLLAWRVLKLSESNVTSFDDDDFENSYLDCEYAFAASYAGAIATTDEGLIETVNAVFPRVEILTGDESTSGS